MYTHASLGMPDGKHLHYIMLCLHLSSTCQFVVVGHLKHASADAAQYFASLCLLHRRLSKSNYECWLQDMASSQAPFAICPLQSTQEMRDMAQQQVCTCNRVRRALENTAQVVSSGADASFTYGQGLLQAGAGGHRLLSRQPCLRCQSGCKACTWKLEMSTWEPLEICSVSMVTQHG